MIKWTAAGAVESPTMLQIRVEKSFEGRIEAGAPSPSRSLTPEELLDNLRYFTKERDGPRTSPCTRLVLSGQGVARRDDLSDAVSSARSWGVELITLHLGEGDIADFRLEGWHDYVDTLVVPVVGAGASLQGSETVMQDAHRAGIAVVSNLQMDPAGMAALPAALDVIVRVRPSSAVFTHPFPRGASDSRSLAPVVDVIRALETAKERLDEAGIPITVKGLPACWIGGLGVRLGRSSNRWYVDASHQRGAALLFFPDVVRLSKIEACRFCSLDTDCDGFFEEWMSRGGYPRLDPQDAS